MIDIEAILTTYLRAQPTVVALAADRVYTDLPNERTYPLVVLSRTGGGYVVNRPQWLDAAEVTLNAYGGSHKTAMNLTNACVESLINLPGQYAEGCVTVARIQAVAYNPDPESPDEDGHARPRFTATLQIFVHP